MADLAGRLVVLAPTQWCEFVQANAGVAFPQERLAMVETVPTLWQKGIKWPAKHDGEGLVAVRCMQCGCPWLYIANAL